MSQAGDKIIFAITSGCASPDVAFGVTLFYPGKPFTVSIPGRFPIN